MMVVNMLARVASGGGGVLGVSMFHIEKKESWGCLREKEKSEERR